MARRFPGGRLVVASHNPGKVREIRELLAPFGVETVSAAELALAEPEETGATFIANAELKARAAAQASGLPALADDSGVSVADLNGDPGIYSARWAGPGKDFALAMRKVKEALEQTPYGRAEGAKAAFISVLSLAYPDGHCDSFEGIVRGRLVWPPRGERGFGYDPMFVAEGYRDTFGEMSPEEKHAISHRADAFRKLIAACFGS